jgi:hypothetical protein
VALDGTKIHANVPDGMSVPEELERRKVRLEKLAAARATIEARAKERFEREQAEHSAKFAARAAKTEATGKKPRGKEPKPPMEGPLPTDQVNLTDEESRIMPVAGGGFEQCYNAQAVVAEGSLLVVAADVVQAANDKQQLAPMLNKVVALPDVLGKVETLLADNGYFSAANVAACEAAQIEPLIAMGRQPHHPSLDERFADAPPPRFGTAVISFDFASVAIWPSTMRCSQPHALTMSKADRPLARSCERRKTLPSMATTP